MVPRLADGACKERCLDRRDPVALLPEDLLTSHAITRSGRRNEGGQPERTLGATIRSRSSGAKEPRTFSLSNGPGGKLVRTRTRHGDNPVNHDVLRRCHLKLEERSCSVCRRTRLAAGRCSRQVEAPKRAASLL